MLRNQDKSNAEINSLIEEFVTLLNRLPRNQQSLILDMINFLDLFIQHFSKEELQILLAFLKERVVTKVK